MTVGSTPPPSAAKRPAADPPETRARVGDDRRPDEAERRTAPAAVEPGPTSPVVLARSRTTTRDDDDDDERRTVPFPARSRRGGDSPHSSDPGRVGVSGLARSRREKSEGPTTTPAAIKWGAVKGKVVAPRTPGVADVAARVVAEMARSRRPAKD
mmetsp:Transcript_10774/g.44836  ORF Transcript_10774/g.44836 Transcript_10774/m.44836 type:complete len:155 (+) Transcript_10774:478-942(+)